MARPWTSLDVVEMALLYQQGMTVEEVGREMGIDQTTVSRRLRKAGVEMRPVGRKRMLVSDDEILRLRGEGLTWPEVAARVGMTMSGVHARWRKMRDRDQLADPMPAELRTERYQPDGGPLSPTVQRTVELYQSGMTQAQVGQAMGLTAGSVGRRLKAAGVAARKPGVRLPVDDMRILELRSRGLTWREIGAEVGMTDGGVKSRFRALREAGYEDPIPPRE